MKLINLLPYFSEKVLGDQSTVNLDEIDLKVPHKDEWVAALRSGNYSQGRGWLHGADGTFCCLGVWEDVSGAQWIIGCGRKYYSVERNMSCIWADYDLRPRLQNILAACNDEGATFEQIANFIEQECIDADN